MLSHGAASGRAIGVLLSSCASTTAPATKAGARGTGTEHGGDVFRQRTRRRAKHHPVTSCLDPRTQDLASTWILRRLDQNGEWQLDDHPSVAFVKRDSDVLAVTARKL